MNPHINIPAAATGHSSFSNPSVASRSFSNLFRHFTYVITHYPTLPSLYLRHSSFSNPSVASRSFSNPFRHFTYVITHYPTLPSLYLRHNSLSNPSVALPTSQFILQPFFRFSNATNSSLNSPGEPPMIAYSSIDCSWEIIMFDFTVCKLFRCLDAIWSGHIVIMLSDVKWSWVVTSMKLRPRVQSLLLFYKGCKKKVFFISYNSLLSST